MILWLAMTLSAAAPRVVASPPMAAPMRKARDPEIAVCEEFTAARAARTRAAWDLFIARHPGHRLLRAAREERALLPAAPAPRG